MTEEPMIRVHDDAAVARHMSVEGTIELLGEVYDHARVGAATSSERTTLEYGEHGWLRTMIATDDVLGRGIVKTFGHSSETSSVRYGLQVFDLASGALVALVDGRLITDLRTGGMGGLVARELHGGRPVRLGVIGSGGQARMQVRAIASVCDVTALRVYSRAADNRAAFAEEMTRELGIDAAPAATEAEALADADVVVTATNTRDLDPNVRAEWLTDHALVLAVGSTRPTSAELDVACLATAEQVLVDIRHAVEEAGEVRVAVEQGAVRRDDVRSLEDVPAPTPDTWSGGRIVFKSVGNAIQDLALAVVCDDAGRAEGPGTEWPTFLSVKRTRRRGT